MGEVVLDASAILAYLLGEPGSERVEAVIEGASVSSVNIAEVVQKLVERGCADALVRASLQDLPVLVEPFGVAAALRVGLLRRKTRSAGLSLGDRACLDLAKQRQWPAFTADRAWAELDLGVEVVLIR